MKKISDVIVSPVELYQRREEKNLNRECDEKTADVINGLFVFFESVCRGFAKQFPDQRKLNIEKVNWLKSFMDVGINTIEQIEYGMRRARLESPINVPRIKDFIEWCSPTPEELGYPSHMIAFPHSTRMNAEFSQYKYPEEKVDTIIRHVIKQIGSFAYRHMSEVNAKKAFEAYYTIAVREAIKGNLAETNKILEDNSSVTKEEKKQDSLVKEEYKGISRESAFSAMRKCLGV